MPQSTTHSATINYTFYTTHIHILPQHILPSAYKKDPRRGLSSFSKDDPRHRHKKTRCGIQRVMCFLADDDWWCLIGLGRLVFVQGVYDTDKCFPNPLGCLVLLQRPLGDFFAYLVRQRVISCRCPRQH